MPYDRRPDRRPGGGRPSGPGRPMGGRPAFGDRPSFGDRPQRPRPDFEERPQRPREDFEERPQRPRDEFTPQPPRGPRPTGFAPRPMDDGGMSIRLDPRRLNALKLLAGEAGMRPGELVTRWVEERLDAARPGAAPSATPIAAAAPDALSALIARVDELAARIDAMTGPTPAAVSSLPAETAIAADPVARPRRGRPPKAAVAATTTVTKAKRGRPRKAILVAAGATKIALHDEIAAVIAERGPQTAAELATAIGERGVYLPPRSAKPLDAAIINARVSNPKYRPGFARAGGRIGLAEK